MWVLFLDTHIGDEPPVFSVPPVLDWYKSLSQGTSKSATSGCTVFYLFYGKTKKKAGGAQPVEKKGKKLKTK